VNLGAWEDKPWGNLEFDEPDQLRYFNADPEKWRPEGAELYADTRARMLFILRELAVRHEGQSVAAVSHGMAIRCLLAAVMGIPSNEPVRVPHADNTAVSLLRAENGILRVEFFNDAGHLSQELSTLAKQNWWQLNFGHDASSLRFAPLDPVNDGELYLECYTDAWRFAHGTEKGFEPRLYLDAARARHKDPETLVAAYKGREFAGLIELDEKRASDVGAGWISLCYLTPAMRGRRYGVQLIGHAVYYFRKRGRRALRLTVAEDNVRAIGFYKHIGFREVGLDQGAVGTLLVMEMDIV
jgi:probable phosphoglycerate mutase